MINVDVIVIGGGPGGLAAAKSAAQSGASVMLLEREKSLGGILNQCVHDGFGLVRYTERLGGPEYAKRVMDEMDSANIQVMTETTVIDIEAGNPHKVKALNTSGAVTFAAPSIVLATGCRERTRGMIGTPGSRPAGVYTAGVAQNLMNMKNVSVGKNIVILGTGDIGLIMARRMTLEGANVICAIEINNDACGLTRNVKQCLLDYDIPVYLSHTVTNIYGRDRLEAIEMSKLSEDGKVIEGSQQIIECDTLILSVGLIPENEVAQTGGVMVDAGTNGAITDEYLQTNVPGIFSCGNCRSIMDLADFVSEQGELAGRNAVAYASSGEMIEWEQELHNTARKGMPVGNEVTCTLCPNGCSLTINELDEVSGNSCQKGIEFALAEKHNPQRILTTTVKIEGGQRKLLPVRSDGSVVFDEIRSIISGLSELCVKSPVRMGDVIIADVGRNHVNIIAQCDM